MFSTSGPLSMKNIKPIVFTLLILTAVLCGYIYLRFDSNYALNEAFSAYEKGDLKKATQFLEEAPSKKSSRYHLCTGLLELSRMKYESAQEAFARALKSNANSELAPKIIAMLQLSDYLIETPNNNKGFTQQQTDPYFNQLFTAIDFFENQEYAKAQEAFDTLPTLSSDAYWLKKAYNRFLPQAYIDLIHCHSLIKQGNNFKARQLLDENTQAQQNFSDYYHFLSGLTYIEESTDKALNLAIPYYKKAFEHFRLIRYGHASNAAYKEEVGKLYTHLLDDILSASLYEELSQFLDLLSIVEVKIQPISQLFFKHLQKETEQDHRLKRLELIQQTLAFCSNATFKERLSQALYFYIEKLLKCHDVEGVKKVWPVYTQVAITSDADLMTFAQIIQSELENTIKQPEVSISQFKVMLELLDALNLSELIQTELLDIFSHEESKTQELFTQAIREALFSKQIDISIDKLKEKLGHKQSKGNPKAEE